MGKKFLAGLLTGKNLVTKTIRPIMAVTLAAAMVVSSGPSYCGLGKIQAEASTGFSASVTNVDTGKWISKSGNYTRVNTYASETPTITVTATADSGCSIDFSWSCYNDKNETISLTKDTDFSVDASNLISTITVSPTDWYDASAAKNNRVYTRTYHCTVTETKGEDELFSQELNIDVQVVEDKENGEKEKYFCLDDSSTPLYGTAGTITMLQCNTKGATPVKYKWWTYDETKEDNKNYFAETTTNTVTIDHVYGEQRCYCDIYYDNGETQEWCWGHVCSTYGLTATMENAGNSYWVNSSKSTVVKVDVSSVIEPESIKYEWYIGDTKVDSATSDTCTVSASDFTGSDISVKCNVTATYEDEDEEECQAECTVYNADNGNDLYYNLETPAVQKLGSTFKFELASSKDAWAQVSKDYSDADNCFYKDGANGEYSCTPTLAGTHSLVYDYGEGGEEKSICSNLYVYDEGTLISNNETVSVSDIHGGETSIYRIKPESNGIYNFEGSTPYVQLIVVDSDNKLVTVFWGSSTTIPLKGNETYYLIVGTYESMDYDDTTSFNFKLTNTTTCEHKFGIIKAKEATCTTAGYTGDNVCEYCSTIKEKGTTIPATGNHANTELRNTKEATCGTPGYTGDKYCKDCGQKIASGSEIPATGNHVWDEGKVTKEATAKEEGEKTYTCSVCNATKTEAIAKIDSSTPVSDVNDAVEGQQVETTDTKASYVATGDGTVTYQAPTSSKSKKVKVPDTVTDASGNKVKVTAVADEAFEGNSKVTDVSLGKNITSVGDKAFANCKNLKQVSLGSKVTEIGKNAFKGDNKLKKITITSKNIKASGISKGAFSGVTSKTTIDVPNKKAAAYKKIFQKKGLNKKVKVK